MGNMETIVHHKVIRRGNIKKNMLAYSSAYRDSQHTRQKRFTHPLKRNTVTCSSQGKPTLVFMDIFSLSDHRLSGSEFGLVHMCMYVCVCV